MGTTRSLGNDPLQSITKTAEQTPLKGVEKEAFSELPQASVSKRSQVQIKLIFTRKCNIEDPPQRLKKQTVNS